MMTHLSSMLVALGRRMALRALRMPLSSSLGARPSDSLHRHACSTVKRSPSVLPPPEGRSCFSTARVGQHVTPQAFHTPDNMLLCRDRSTR